MYMQWANCCGCSIVLYYSLLVVTVKTLFRSCSILLVCLLNMKNACVLACRQDVRLIRVMIKIKSPELFDM